MKNLFINCILASLALLAVLSCRQEDEVVVEPRLDMVTDSVIAEPDGGHYVIEYVLSNPVEGVSVVASSAQNWITDFVYEDGRIGFDVGGNTEVSSREGLVRVTYGDYMGFDVPVCQAAAGYAGYEMAADYFFGTYYGDMYGESYNFYVILSDTDVHDDGSFADGGNYYVFDMYCSEPEEGKLVPAEGTYVLGEAGSTASMTFSSEMSCAYLPYREEDYGTELYFYDDTKKGVFSFNQVINGDKTLGDNIALDIQEELCFIESSRVDEIRALSIVLSDRNEIWFLIPTSEPDVKTIMIFDYIHREWVKRKCPYTGQIYRLVCRRKL